MGPLRNQRGQLCMEPQEMDKVLHEYFSSTEWKAREKIAGALVEIYELSTNMSEVPAD